MDDNNNTVNFQRNCGGVPGLYLLRNFLTEDEESQLIGAIDREHWTGTNKSRRTQVFQHCARVQVDTQSQCVDELHQLYVPWKDDGRVLIQKEGADMIPLPPHAVETALRILAMCQNHLSESGISWHDYNITDTSSTELQMNEYSPESTLRYHYDNTVNYKEVIFGVSLVCDCCLYFVNTHGQEHKIVVPARSLYLMTGPARYQFKHGIKENSLLFGDRRVSMTYRTIIYGSPSSTSQSSPTTKQLQKKRGRHNKHQSE